MKYIIMCGGVYRRWEKPRQLLPYKGEPIVARTIRLLRESGVEDIAISTNNEAFAEFGVPLLKHENSYNAIAYNEVSGHWCDAFYPTDEPTCYLMGDVIFSEAAIKTIVETEVDGIMLFASAPPFAKDYPKKWAEPFALKVTDTDRLHEAIEDVKRMDAEGWFYRKPIAWELWNVISRGTKGDPNWIDYKSYVAINDWTCDIDDPSEVRR